MAPIGALPTRDPRSGKQCGYGNELDGQPDCGNLLLTTDGLGRDNGYLRRVCNSVRSRLVSLLLVVP